MQMFGGEKMQIAECNKPVAENVQRIISEKGIKQSAIAARINITPSAFNAMLRGRKLIKPCDIRNIANVLEVEVNELYEKRLPDGEKND